MRISRSGWKKEAQKMPEEILPPEIQNVVELWKTKKEKYLAEWSSMVGWPAKYVSIVCEYHGKDYMITPEMIGEEDPWGHGFMEFINTKMGEDLEKAGATSLAYFGELD